MLANGKEPMKRILLIPAVLFPILLCAATGLSQDGTSIPEAFRKINSVKAEFLQKRHLQILKDPLLSEGRLFFDASGFLRWEYRKPLRSVMLQKGDALQLFYFSEGRWKPEMIQAVEARRMVLAEIQQWFQGRFAESKVFSPSYSPGPPARVVLTPREGINKFIHRIEIVLSAKPGVIERVEIEEPGNSRTSIEFRNVEINPRFPSGIFEKP
jgi:outer membrane lipoprotein carrier protein